MLDNLPRQASVSNFRYAAAHFLSIAITLSVLLFIGHYLDRQFEKQHWMAAQAKTVAAITAEASRYYYESLSDLLVLADNRALFSASDNSNAELGSEFERIARISRSYHQLRFIDTTGQEMVRVNFSGNTATRVTTGKLQNKAHRPYFQKSINLKEGEVYVSRFDLNVEHKQIEKPYRPVIRFATPVFDPEGNKRGILVLNYLGEKLLHQFAVSDQEDKSHIILLNDQGYYLYSDNQEQTWGFQIAGRPRFQDQFREWTTITQKHAGQLNASQGLLTYATINYSGNTDQQWIERYTPMHGIRIVAEEAPWRIVSFTPTELLYSAANNRFYYSLSALLFLLLLILPISVVWGRSHARAKYLENRQRIYAQIFEQINELIYITDTDGTILYANSTVEGYTGYSINEIIGKTPHIFYSGKQTGGFYKRLWDTINSGESFEGYFVNRCKDGSIFYEHKIITPLRDSLGKVTQFVSTGRDITGTRNMREKEMIATSDLASNLVHHFGNLLQGVMGLTQLTLTKKETHKAFTINDFLVALLETAKNSGKMLTDIRSLTVIGHEELPLVDLKPLLQETVESLRKDLPEQITLSSNFENNIPSVRSHSSLILTAIMALLSNARDAVCNEGEIVVGVGMTSPQNTTCTTCGEPLNGDYMEIFVSDSGKGISKKTQERIWDPFFTTKKSGLLVAVTPGLGLTAVRSIIHSHQGHILLESIEKSGTTVRLLLPLEKSLDLYKINYPSAS